ncbi:MAG: ThuA domain-containing protein [Bryobacteraceae bacterium]
MYITHSAGFVHDSIQVSRQVLSNLSPDLEVVTTTDLSQISAENLRSFDVVFFFTSGELNLSGQQKSDLLNFVREGKAFGGVHSATDTLYTWPEYGEMIGGYFDGHPWAQDVEIDIEDPGHPIVRHLAPSFRIADEIYQFREFSRDRVRVLMTLDTGSVNLNAPGVNRADGDFALAWVRNYGRGRVFYTALGHGDETWLDPRFQEMLCNALLWLAGEIPGEAAPRPVSPKIAAGGVVNGASYSGEALAPGSIVSIFGETLTSGSTLVAARAPWPVKLAGTSVLVNDAAIPLLYVSPGQINAQLPLGLALSETARVVVRSVNQSSAPESVRLEAAAPGLFAIAESNRTISIYGTGLGPVEPGIPAGSAAPLSPLSRTAVQPEVTVGGVRANVLFSGLAPLFVGLYQVNAVLPPGLPPGPAAVQVEMGGRKSNPISITIAP